MFGSQRKWIGLWLQQSREARWYKSAPLVSILKWVRKEGVAGAKGDNFKVMRQRWWTLALPPIPSTFLDLLMPSLTERQYGKIEGRSHHGLATGSRHPSVVQPGSHSHPTSHDSETLMLAWHFFFFIKLHGGENGEILMTENGAFRASVQKQTFKKIKIVIGHNSDNKWKFSTPLLNITFIM